MNTAIDQLALSLLKKPLNEFSAEELQRLSFQYPWFAPVQLLYAKKLQAGGDSSLYHEQLEKTSLYFQNRLWLHHILNDTGKAAAGKIIPSPAEQQSSIVSVSKSESEITGEEKGMDEIVPGQETLEMRELTISEQPIDVSEEVKNATIAAKEELPGAIHKNEFIESDPPDPKPADDPGFEEDQEIQDRDEPQMRIPQLKIEPINPETATLSFQPYHTVDYFASQGIKAKETGKTQDRFGQQLKSFTEWLKVLKKMPDSEISTSVSDPGAERKVEQLAEHSLAERHVVTEAMAEVWIKQGNIAKAEEIYRKLSLLDPPKTVYFAAKIEDLKKTS